MLNKLEKQIEETMYSMPNVPKDQKLKKVWVVAKPFLEMLSDSFFIPKKFRLVLDVLIEGIDLVLTPEQKEDVKDQFANTD